MPVLRRLGRLVGFTVLAMLVAVAATVAVRCATVPPPPGLPPDFAVTPDSSVRQPALRAELLRGFALDQAVREDVGGVGLRPCQPGGLWTYAGEAIRTVRVDRPEPAPGARDRRADGWPTAGEIGRDGMEALFFIVQHAGLGLQQEALAPFRAAWQRGELDSQHLALLTDRVRMFEGRPQLYGSQFRATLGTA